MAARAVEMVGMEGSAVLAVSKVVVEARVARAGAEGAGSCREAAFAREATKLDKFLKPTRTRRPLSKHVVLRSSRSNLPRRIGFTFS